MELAKRLRAAMGQAAATTDNTVKVARTLRPEDTESSEYERPEWWTP